MLPITVLTVLSMLAADTRADTVAMIDKQLEVIEEAPADKVDQLRQLAESVIEAQPDNVIVREELSSALEDVTKENASQQEAALTLAILKAKATLAFKPIREAKLPEGFPEPTPAGELQVKSYPAYRMARTEMKAGQGSAFGVLFNHIKNNEIAMTAPVEMEYRSSSNDKLETKSMAFLYRSKKIGELLNEDQVEVIDVPAMTTISLGLRGEYDAQQVSRAKSHLEQWIAESEQYEVAGELRLMGYNSPIIPTAMRYAEVELPIKKK